MTEETLEVRASARYIPMSPQKVRLVVDLIRGMDVNEALDLLRFTNKAAAKPVYKVLRSAVANAEENFGLNRDDLFVHTIYADQAPIRHWRRFGARGRFKRIKRRYSHITVLLREREFEGV
jgi:large subunit ribosomal protein L22